jgi:hypothetical protein
MKILFSKIIKKLVEGVSFLGGFERDGAKTSGFFKLQKIRTLEKDMPRKSFLIAIIFVFILIFSPFSISQAQINEQINYQGKLTDEDGIAVPDTTYAMEFILYDDPALSGEHILWTETRTGGNEVQVTSGLFSVLLG